MGKPREEWEKYIGQITRDRWIELKTLNTMAEVIEQKIDKCPDEDNRGKLRSRRRNMTIGNYLKLEYRGLPLETVYEPIGLI